MGMHWKTTWMGKLLYRLDSRRNGGCPVLTIDDIRQLPISGITADKAHLYLWVPNALLPDGLAVMEACSQGPRIELFARGVREGWDMWGNQATEDYEPDWNTYSNHTIAHAK